MADSQKPAVSEITGEAVYARRREFMRNALSGPRTAAAVGATLMSLLGDSARPRKEPPRAKAAAPRALAISTRWGQPDLRQDPLTSFADITSYNNYYELGLDKSDPANNA